MAKLQLRRGLKSELDQILLDVGEIGFTTDTREVWVGSGTANVLIGRVLVGTLAFRPTAGVAGRVYFTTDENVTYIDNGTQWKSVGNASIDTLPDGSTYGRVLLSELDANKVKQLYAVTSAVSVDAEAILTHLLNETFHREINDATVSTTELWSSSKIDTDKADKVDSAVQDNIVSLTSTGNIQDSGLKRNDSGTSTLDLWSANKIQNEINSKLSGLFWNEPVLVLNMLDDTDKSGAEPVSPGYGDAYIVNNWGGSYIDNEIREWNGTNWTLISTLAADTRVLVKSVGPIGSFVTQENNIGVYNGTSWTFYTPDDGYAIIINGDGSVYENSGFTFADTIWVQFTGAGQINAGTGLLKEGNTLSVDLGPGITETVEGIAVDVDTGLKLTDTADTGKLAIDYDDTTIGIVNDKLAVKLIDENNLAATIAGDGLIGGEGTPLSVNIGEGLQILADILNIKLQDAGGLVLTANGLGLSVDGQTLVIDEDNQVVSTTSETVDGGLFEDYVPPGIFSAMGPDYWMGYPTDSWNGSEYTKPQGQTSIVLNAFNNWASNTFNFTGVKVTFTCSLTTIPKMVVGYMKSDYYFTYPEYLNISSETLYTFSIPAGAYFYRIGFYNLGVNDTLTITNIEFNVAVPELTVLDYLTLNNWIHPQLVLKYSVYPFADYWNSYILPTHTEVAGTTTDLLEVDGQDYIGIRENFGLWYLNNQRVDYNPASLGSIKIVALYMIDNWCYRDSILPHYLRIYYTGTIDKVYVLGPDGFVRVSDASYSNGKAIAITDYIGGIIIDYSTSLQISSITFDVPVPNFSWGTIAEIIAAGAGVYDPLDKTGSSTGWYSTFQNSPSDYWKIFENCSINTTTYYNTDGATSFLIKADGDWHRSYVPYQVRITFTGTLDSLYIMNPDGTYYNRIVGPLTTQYIGNISYYPAGFIFDCSEAVTITNIEFDVELPVLL